jgi:(R)-2-hydroxyacyl-CoA dehydratese activating ATPase
MRQEGMMYYLGIDIGSLSCDAVVIDDAGVVLGAVVLPTGARNRETIARARAEVLREAGITADQVAAVVSTGYGRNRVEDRLAAVTEITCHAKGIQALFPGTEVLIDVGGQDSKAIRFGPGGLVADFAMNDKCAAGTGRFLEAMARALEMDIDEMCNLDIGAQGATTISSMCTVFAESEVVSLVADGVDVKEIVAALNRSIASRVHAMVSRIAPDADVRRVAMSGGVARNHGVVRALEQTLGCTIRVPDSPDTVGALGAALIAGERATR